MYSLGLVTILIVSISLISITGLASPAEAIKAKGVPTPEINSKKVCGVELCTQPMTIAEKIAMYLETILGKTSPIPEKGRFAMGGVGDLGLN